jgi:hypothetical protein
LVVCYSYGNFEIVIAKRSYDCKDPINGFITSRTTLFISDLTHTRHNIFRLQDDKIINFNKNQLVINFKKSSSGVFKAV